MADEKFSKHTSTKASHDADDSYGGDVVDNVKAAIGVHVGAVEGLVDKQTAVLNNKNATAAQKAASMAVGVSETMMAKKAP